MRKILLTTDFSHLATQACVYGLQMANALGAKVHLLHVFRKGGNYATARPQELTHALEKGEEEASLELFQAYAEGLLQQAGVQVPIDAILEKGKNVSEKITEFADFIETDMIVMGMQGYSKQFAKLNRIIGNTTTQVINQSKRSVLAMPKDARFQSISHLIYATNFEEKDQRIPGEIVELMKKTGGRLSCVHIRQHEDAWITEVQLKLLAEIYALETENIDIHFYSIPHKHVREGLNKFVSQYGGDMLALLTHARLSVFGQLFDLNLSREMSFHSKVPLWVLHQDR